MYFSVRQSGSKTIITLAEEPSEAQISAISSFIDDRGGEFIDKNTYKEFSVKKLLTAKHLEQYFKHINLPFVVQEASAGIADKKLSQYIQRQTSVYKMTFGKHKGEPINTIPQSYLKWIIDTQANPDLIKICSCELKARNTIHIL